MGVREALGDLAVSLAGLSARPLQPYVASAQARFRKSFAEDEPVLWQAMECLALVEASGRRRRAPRGRADRRSGRPRRRGRGLPGALDLEWTESMDRWASELYAATARPPGTPERHWWWFRAAP